jgi:hypothetical protein
MYMAHSWRMLGSVSLVDIQSSSSSNTWLLAGDLKREVIPVIESKARLAADHAYIDALRRGEEPVDARLGPDADWLSGPHQSNMEQAKGR